ncbi:MAG: DUF1848 family protein, partial [bacterium]
MRNNHPMKTVISCSRRTDIPAFHYGWLQGVLAEGAVRLINRYNQKEYIVDLRPESVHSLVLWSRNYAHFLADPGFLSNYFLYFQFTLTGYPKFLEPGAPSETEALRQMSSLARACSPGQINWRFDPLLFLQSPDLSLKAAGEERLQTFERLCRQISGMGIRRCTVSFISLYSSVGSRLSREGLSLHEMEPETQRRFAGMLAERAKAYGIELFSCCQIHLEGIPGIRRGSCIDGGLLQELFGGKTSKARDTGQRKHCGCTRSLDIGSYRQECPHSCLYCYAQNTKP